MKRYLVLVENPLDGVCEVSFFAEYTPAWDLVDSLRDEGYYVELYERNSRCFDGRVVGFEYRRVN